MNWKTMPFTLINMWLLVAVFLSCTTQSKSEAVNATNASKKAKNLQVSTPNIPVDISKPRVVVAANQTEAYFHLLQGKKVGVVANQTSLIQKGDTAIHLVDSLLKTGIQVKTVFSPEHGFRGDQGAGAHVKHSTDHKTGLPIFSLHGSTKKPTAASLKGIDVIVFDIQDVGVRFYTYISSLHYVMEACAENNVSLIVLDRPNPNAFYVSGPVLQPKFKSFIGMHPVPVVYGMSIGEYATMINGEYWLKDSVQCELKVIKLQNWNHQTTYNLPVPPSPNLNNQLAIYLYPHLCFFEGTDVSVGRGTPFPFQQYGHPMYKDSSYSFTPVSTKGASLDPPQENIQCFGRDLRSIPLENLRKLKKLDLSYLFDAQTKVNTKEFITKSQFFNLLAGNDTFQKTLKEGKSDEEIQNSWKEELEAFKLIRLKYLLY